jgi:hypothetical protein
VTSEPEGQCEKKNSKHQRISTDPQNNRQRTSTWGKQDQHAKQQGKHSHHNQQPLIRDGFSETNAGNNFKDPVKIAQNAMT